MMLFILPAPVKIDNQLTRESIIPTFLSFEDMHVHNSKLTCVNYYSITVKFVTKP